ncbi:hypothetical protein P3W85_42305 [Cupriavidus basilensis]|uniref:Uncharacterized protein n=1 Tax=Cupriavidus basilensis TaxID=68895 RepID=A0ABT6B3S6_9BURK|nr:hypothetical protein [Cupriavidus basilensis]MDF3839525.1 hypothetical protein [Cupriavidus basilensis]
MNTTLTIQDLPVTEALDSRAMRAVRGGYMPFLPVFSTVKLDSTFNASQLIGQTQNVVNMNGNNTAFAADIKSHVDSTQNASNNIYR